MIRLLYIAVLLLTAGVTLAGCSNSDCSDYRSTLPLARFYSGAGGTAAGIAFDSLSVQGIGVPGDSMLIDGAHNVSETYLPLPADRREAAFALIYATVPHLLADTITFYYTPAPHFTSAECGVVYYYDVKAVSHTSLFLDSVVLLTNPLTNVPQENMRLYFN